MKKTIIVILVLTIVMGTLFAQQARYRNGVYTSTQTRPQPDPPADPVGGNVTVAVTFRSNRITRIEITETKDTDDYVNIVKNFFLPDLIEAQNPDIDAFAGATGTSTAVKNAVRDAMSQAAR